MSKDIPSICEMRAIINHAVSDCNGANGGKIEVPYKTTFRRELYLKAWLAAFEEKHDRSGREDINDYEEFDLSLPVKAYYYVEPEQKEERNTCEASPQCAIIEKIIIGDNPHNQKDIMQSIEKQVIADMESEILQRKKAEWAGELADRGF